MKLPGCLENQYICRGTCHARRKYRMGNTVFGYNEKGYKWILIPCMRLLTLKQPFLNF